ncbi:hypothetical protein ACIBFB_21445 [Nocardiopsis sp. NPDC050513]|uniref:hypothetical protein n=1 Tax=Nocardiopsis sp. NPDC050513 TaxID=3364338 RepID=UPI0037938022
MKFELVEPPDWSDTPSTDARQPARGHTEPGATGNVVPVTSLDRMRDRSDDHAKAISQAIAAIQPSLTRMNARIAEVGRELADTGHTGDDPPDGFRPDRFSPRRTRIAPQESP